MDIHVPKPWHGWREFLKEYGTIVLGVLTAIALEQAVEAIHHQRERTELRESLRSETDQILLDTARVEKSEHDEIVWEDQIGGVLARANRGHEPLGPLPPAPPSNFDVPDNPIYRAAQSSGKLALLSNDEREVYSELDGLIGKVGAAYAQREEATTAVIENQRTLRLGRATGSTAISDFRISTSFPQLVGSNFSSQDLEKLLDGTVRVEVKVARFIYWSRQARGAATALQQGETKLRNIQAAERQFDGLP
ncbi:hypothetical protein BH11PSE1_BH11PSE1_27960 [soil metagenome]